jgi:hypothetical protein
LHISSFQKRKKKFPLFDCVHFRIDTQSHDCTEKRGGVNEGKKKIKVPKQKRKRKKGEREMFIRRHVMSVK